MSKFIQRVTFLLLALLLITITGCTTTLPTSTNEQPPSPIQTGNPVTSEVGNVTPPPEATIQPSNSPVDYNPAWPDRTVKSSNGHLVNSCVPEQLRDKATTLISDGAYLSALVLGSGDKGVLLAHEQGYNICSFLDMGIELAESGYLVVIP